MRVRHVLESLSWSDSVLKSQIARNISAGKRKIRLVCATLVLFVGRAGGGIVAVDPGLVCCPKMLTKGVLVGMRRPSDRTSATMVM